MIRSFCNADKYSLIHKIEFNGQSPTHCPANGLICAHIVPCICAEFVASPTESEGISLFYWAKVAYAVDIEVE